MNLHKNTIVVYVTDPATAEMTISSTPFSRSTMRPAESVDQSAFSEEPNLSAHGKALQTTRTKTHNPNSNSLCSLENNNWQRVASMETCLYPGQCRYLCAVPAVLTAFSWRVIAIPAAVGWLPWPSYIGKTPHRTCTPGHGSNTLGAIPSWPNNEQFLKKPKSINFL